MPHQARADTPVIALYIARWSPYGKGFRMCPGPLPMAGIAAGWVIRMALASRNLYEFFDKLVKEFVQDRTQQFSRKVPALAIALPLASCKDGAINAHQHCVCRPQHTSIAPQEMK